MKSLRVIIALGVASFGLFMLLNILVGMLISGPFTLIFFGLTSAGYLALENIS